MVLLMEKAIKGGITMQEKSKKIYPINIIIISINNGRM